MRGRGRKRPSTSPYARANRTRQVSGTSNGEEVDEAVFDQEERQAAAAVSFSLQSGEQAGSGGAHASSSDANIFPVTHPSIQSGKEQERDITLPMNAIPSSYAPTPIQSVNDQVGEHVAQNMKEKIWNGEYIDLAALLDTSPDSQNLQSIVLVNGAFQVRNKPSKHKIDTIEKWSDAFIIFMGIFTQKHGRFNEMLKYMSNIRFAEKMFPGLGWKQYDEQFRLRKAKHPSSSWATIDAELWLMFVSSRQPTPQQTQSQTFSGHNKGKCFDFNFKGSCQKVACNFLHTCLRCGANHAQLNCNKAVQGSSRFRPQQYNKFTPNKSNPVMSSTKNPNTATLGAGTHSN